MMLKKLIHSKNWHVVVCKFLILSTCIVNAQKPYVSKVWTADNGDGTYKNPILHADYSDPDVIRVDTDYYMTSSSFEDAPGLPILHSKDLVNWSLIAHALPRQIPLTHFSIPRHGEGVWAPSIRYRNREFLIYYPDPDFGIYLIKAKDPAGPWSKPILVESGKGLIDPCPLWDDDGNVYLVHAFAGSRAGIKSILVVKKMNKEGTKTIDAGVIVYDGHDKDPTIEGPKFYKRGGWYYIFAPAGGVSTGWQLVLRSRKIYGPYERKVVMDQGNSSINGPHQGAWVTTSLGEDWFIHFQDKGNYGRIVHLQPMKWVNNWPVIGADNDGDGKGEPVVTYRKPVVHTRYKIVTPEETDEFNGFKPGLQWQWQANPKATWSFVNIATGTLRLFSDVPADSGANLWHAGNVLLQKFPAEEFMVTTKLTFSPSVKDLNERAGLVIMGNSYAGLALKQSEKKLKLVYFVANNAAKRELEKETVLMNDAPKTIYLQIVVKQGGKCQFRFSTDGILFKDSGIEFTAEPARWKGAKMGLFCARQLTTNDSGFADVDWFRVEAIQ